MNKADFLDLIVETAEISHYAADRAFEAMFKAATESLAAGDKVSFGKFANLSRVVRAPRAKRMGRNPSTGEAMEIAAQPAKNAVKFSAGKALKDAMNQ